MSTLTIHTLLALILLALPFGALYVFDRPTIRPLTQAILRGLIQLLVICLVVWGVIKVDRWWLSIIWLIAMSVGAALLVIRRCRLSVGDGLLPTCIGIFSGTFIIGLWLLGVVLPVDTFSARWFIPMMGVLLGHSSAMLVRGLSTFIMSFKQDLPQYDFRLGNGSSPFNALRPFVRSALLAMMTPTIANLSVLALCNLPLLLCGMLIGGLSPINAFAIMLFTMAGCVASSVLSLGVTLVFYKSLVK